MTIKNSSLRVQWKSKNAKAAQLYYGVHLGITFSRNGFCKRKVKLSSLH